MWLWQGHGSVAVYAIEFHTISADSGWNNSALIAALLNVFFPKIKYLPISLEIPDKLGGVFINEGTGEPNPLQ